MRTNLQVLASLILNLSSERSEQASTDSCLAYLTVQIFLKVPFEYALDMIAIRNPNMVLRAGFAFVARPLWGSVLGSCFRRIFREVGRAAIGFPDSLTP
jgi:hypothetical protein